MSCWSPAGLNAVKYLSIQIITGVSFFLPEFLAKNFGTVLNKGLPQSLYVLLGAFILGFNPESLKSVFPFRESV